MLRMQTALWFRATPGLPMAVLMSGLLALAQPPDAAAKDKPAPQRVLLDRAFKAAADSKWKDARAFAVRAGNPLAEKIVNWMWLTTPASTASFEKISNFIDQEPGWPRQNRLRRRAEESLTAKTPNEVVFNWFRHRKPATVDGSMRLAAAYLATGRRAEAAGLLRRTWIEGNFGARQERQFYRRYRKHLTRDDHIERLDRLLWQGRRYPVRRMYRRVNTKYRALAEARLTLRLFRGGVDRAISRVPDELQSHPGLVYERLRWRRRKGRDLDARELLVDPPTDLIQPERWWRERAILARRALQAGHVSEAYNIAQQHGLTEGAGFVEAEWLSGWIALRFLKEEADSYPHFAKVYRVSRYPISRARGAYWAGRAAEAMGDIPRSRFWYRTAAGFPTTYYGQLAASRYRRDASLEIPVSPHIDSIEDAAFETHELVRAARLLAGVRNPKLIEPFIRRLNQIGRTPGWRSQVTELAGRGGRDDLAVFTAKQAYREGVGLGEAGYPTLSAPVRKGLEKSFLLALIRQESAFNRNAVSHAGARGLMQIMPRTAQRVAKSIRKPYDRRRLTEDPDYNLNLGQAYLTGLLEEFRGSYILSLAAYNAGPGRARRWMRKYGDPRDAAVDAVDWVEQIPFNETRNYVQRVIENLHVYRQQLDPARLAFNPEGDLRR